MRSEASSSSNNSRGESVVVDWGPRRSSCGYCKSAGRTSISHGLWADSITVDDYQDLLDRGWRRSGCFLYKPEMERTCCPSYTIRLKASDFVPSKEQLRVYRRIQRFLDGTLDVKKPVDVIENPITSKSARGYVHEAPSSAADKPLSSRSKEDNQDEQFIHYLSDQIDSAVHMCIEGGEFTSGIQLPKAVVKKVSQAKRKLLVEGAEDLLYASNIAFQVAAALRRLQTADKDVHQLRASKESGPCPKSIAEKLVNYINQLEKISGLSIRACNGHINFYSNVKQASMDGDVQIVNVHKDSTTGSASNSSCSNKFSVYPQVQIRKLEIHLKKSSFDPEEYALYKRYQIRVHNDTPDRVTESSYRRFLVDTPLLFLQPSDDGTVAPCGFGSFHQQYRIDGQLVAVGVVDILPRCLSSKYLFWDPDYAFLSLGKYSALQEIDWVKQNQAHCPSLQYYYLGYYIHSCNKMRYKAAYHPSELLCPLHYQWVPFDIARPLLDKKKYVVLSDYATLQNGESSLSSLPEIVMEWQHNDVGQEDSNDVLVDGDEDMIELESESSDDELEPEASGLISADDGDLTDLLIGLKGSRVRYEDIQHAFGPPERYYLETQLRSYQRVVGLELSKRMVYSLG